MEKLNVPHLTKILLSCQLRENSKMQRLLLLSFVYNSVFLFIRMSLGARLLYTTKKYLS